MTKDQFLNKKDKTKTEIATELMLKHLSKTQLKESQRNLRVLGRLGVDSLTGLELGKAIEDAIFYVD